MTRISTLTPGWWTPAAAASLQSRKSITNKIEIEFEFRILNLEFYKFRIDLRPAPGAGRARAELERCNERTIHTDRVEWESEREINEWIDTRFLFFLWHAPLLAPAERARLNNHTDTTQQKKLNRCKQTRHSFNWCEQRQQVFTESRAAGSSSCSWRARNWRGHRTR